MSWKKHMTYPKLLERASILFSLKKIKADKTQQLISVQFELKKVFFFLKTFIKVADKPFLFFQLGVDTIKPFFLSL